jgi:hypothetical protein
MEPSDADKALVERLTEKFNRGWEGPHRRFREKATHHFELYHNYNRWTDWLPRDRRDRDIAVRDSAQDWGAGLFIPYSFATVETILPRMLSNRPSILITPRGPASEQNVENMKWTIEAQQEQIDYELVLQKAARNGLICGLGVQKVTWFKDERIRKALQPNQIPTAENPHPFAVGEETRVVFDDPMIRSVDPFNFIWDPMAESMDTCEYVFERVWRSTEYCLRMLRLDIWSGFEERDVTEGSQGSAMYTEAFSGRQRASGYPNLMPKDVHEVWEFHDGNEVITVLDRRWVVQQGMNPAWHGELPYQAWRPTPVEGQFAGKGEIEPIEDLQSEINTLRSQRRDNATLVLQKSFFYADGAIDPADFKIGPGLGIPVLGSDLNDVIRPIDFGEIPNSSVNEERSLMADIERATGIDDSLNGSGNGSQTATGVQLVQAAANVRIQMKTRGCEVELVRSGGRQMVALNQQRIRSNRDVRVPVMPTPEQPDRRWAWRQIGPAELAGEFLIDVEGGSMAPENVPQQRNDARDMLAMMNTEIGKTLDPKQVSAFILRNMGIKGTESWIVPPPQEVPPEKVDQIFKAMEAVGVDHSIIEQIKQSVFAPGGQ